MSTGRISPTPFLSRSDEGFVPNEIAQGGWGPTLGGQVVGGLLARTIEQHVNDGELHPARFTVEILRRVATAPVQVESSVVRSGRRMRSLDAVMTQHGELVARATALYLRRGVEPDGDYWTMPITMPAPPEEPIAIDYSLPMFIQPLGLCSEPGDGFPWQCAGPRYAWIREIRNLVEGEALSPFVRAAMAVDVTSSMTNFSTTGLAFINADYTLALSRLPDGPFVGLAAVTHYSGDGVSAGSTTLFDGQGPIGIGVSTAVSNFGFSATRHQVRRAPTEGNPSLKP
jgi:hypothetical protein